jgi:ABC-type Na+ efflux pump permease subunit
MNFIKKLIRKESDKNQVNSVDNTSTNVDLPNNKTTTDTGITNDPIANNNFVRINIGHQAQIDAQASMGNSSSLQIKLDELYSDYKNMQERNEEFQAQQRAEIQNRIDELNLSKRSKETELNINNESIRRLDNESKAAITDIELAKSNPSKLNPPLIDKNILTPLFYMGCFFLFVVGLFLIFFYAIQVASLSVPGGDKLLDPEVIYAYLNQQHGVGKLPVFLIPFIFLALGILIHIFEKQEEEKFEALLERSQNENEKTELRKQKENAGIPKAVVYILALSFIMDIILAYLVIRHNWSNSHVGNITLVDAISDLQFWYIIILGFVTYIVWGLIFNWVMNTYEKSNKVKIFIKHKQELLTRNEERKNQIIKDNNVIELAVTDIDSKVNSERNRMQNPQFNFANYHTWHSQYISGWINGINHLANVNVITPQRQGDLSNQTIETSKAFLICNNLNNINTNL